MGLINKEDDEYMYLAPLIDMEMKTDLYLIESDLNKDELEKAYKVLNIKNKVNDDFQIKGYWSTCQTLVCGEWFFQFLDTMFRLYTTSDISMVELGQQCYKEVLAKHHNWFLRTTVIIAINIINSRETFENSLCNE